MSENQSKIEGNGGGKVGSGIFGIFKFDVGTGLKVNDQLVAYATRFLAVRLKKYVWSHHRALKAKVYCDFSSAYSPDHTNVL